MRSKREVMDGRGTRPAMTKTGAPMRRGLP